MLAATRVVWEKDFFSMKIALLVALFIFSLPAYSLDRPIIGIDLNVPQAIKSLTSDQKYIAGTISVANPTSRYELAMPFFLYDYTFDADACCIVKLERFDLQLRVFNNRLRHGFYYGIIARRSSVSGMEYFDHTTPASYDRVGVGVVLGFKQIYFDRVYWGANLNVGQFLSEAELLADGSRDAAFFIPSENGSSEFFNIEFLKLGIRF